MLLFLFELPLTTACCLCTSNLAADEPLPVPFRILLGIANTPRKAAPGAGGRKRFWLRGRENL
jgi:hypothetical protein